MLRDPFPRRTAYSAIPAQDSDHENDSDTHDTHDIHDDDHDDHDHGYNSDNNGQGKGKYIDDEMSPLSRSSSEKLKAPHVSLDEFPTASSTGPSTGPSYAGASSVSPGDPPQYRVYRRRFLGLFMLILLNIMVSWAWLTFSPVVSLAAAHYRVSESAINWLSTSILFAYVVATPAVIYSLHRFSTKPTLLAACLLLLAGNWIRYAGARAASFPVTMVGQLLIGAAQPFVLSAPPHYSDAWFTPAGRISATAAASLANPVGAALGQLINPMWATAPEDIPDMVLWVAVITTVGVLGWVLVPTRPPTPPCASAAPHPTPTPRAAVAALLANREWIALTAMFWIYLGGFNALSTLLPQIMIPRGYTLDTAGLTGALLIVVGLIAAAVIAPIVDRTHAFTTAIRTLVPITAATYVAFIWAPHEGALAPPFVVAAVMGAGSFALLPVALEWAGEITYPVPTEWASGVMWAGGQLVGGVLIVGMDAMKGLGEGGGGGKDGGEGREGDMRAAVGMLAAIAVLAAPGVWLIGRKRGRGMGRLGVAGV